MSCGLQDVIELEAPGMPAVLAASSAFVSAADGAVGAARPAPLRRVFVTHPIQDRTDDEMRELARGAADELLAAVS